MNVNVNLIEKNGNQINGGITINVDAKKTSYMRKKLCLESCYMQLSKWKIPSKYYGLFNDYL